MTDSSRIDHIIWDWNGTIFGDSRALIDATIDTFATSGMAPITRADYQRHHTQPIPAFYDRLVGRRLTDEEQARLDRGFHEAYARHRALATLTADAAETLALWADTGRSQSLLSMYPHDRLMPLVVGAGIDGFFTRIDGTDGVEIARKTPHLARHLRHLGVPPMNVLMVGDSVDDAIAAGECGVQCVIYHGGEDALHSLDHFKDSGVPIVSSLREAVARVVDGDGWAAAGPATVMAVVEPSGES